jgi:hypothetical protein
VAEHDGTQLGLHDRAGEAHRPVQGAPSSNGPCPVRRTRDRGSGAPQITRISNTSPRDDAALRPKRPRGTVRTAYQQAMDKVRVRQPLPLLVDGHQAVPDRVEWLRSEMLKTRIANGYRSRDLVAEACPYANICEQCDNFVTTTEFLPALQHQLADVLASATTPRHAAGTRKQPAMPASSLTLRTTSNTCSAPLIRSHLVDPPPGPGLMANVLNCLPKSAHPPPAMMFRTSPSAPFSRSSPRSAKTLDAASRRQRSAFRRLVAVGVPWVPGDSMAWWSRCAAVPGPRRARPAGCGQRPGPGGANLIHALKKET